MKHIIFLLSILLPGVLFSQNNNNSEDTTKRTTVVKSIENSHSMTIEAMDSLYSDNYIYNSKTHLWEYRDSNDLVIAEGILKKKFYFRLFKFLYIREGVWVYYSEDRKVVKIVVYNKNGYIISEKIIQTDEDG
jgi:hypothetical protein